MNDNSKHQKKSPILNQYEAFTCPITCEVFSDPVITIADGHTYERAAIIEWFKTHNTSPRTGLALKTKEIVPNFVLQGLISEINSREDNQGSSEKSSIVLNSLGIGSTHDWLLNINVPEKDIASIVTAIQSIGGIDYLGSISGSSKAELKNVLRCCNPSIAEVHYETIISGIQFLSMIPVHNENTNNVKESSSSGDQISRLEAAIHRLEKIANTFENGNTKAVPLVPAINSKNGQTWSQNKDGDVESLFGPSSFSMNDMSAKSQPPIKPYQPWLPNFPPTTSLKTVPSVPIKAVPSVPIRPFGSQPVASDKPSFNPFDVSAQNSLIDSFSPPQLPPPPPPKKQGSANQTSDPFWANLSVVWPMQPIAAGIDINQAKLAGYVFTDGKASCSNGPKCILSNQVLSLSGSPLVWKVLVTGSQNWVIGAISEIAQNKDEYLIRNGRVGVKSYVALECGLQHANIHGVPIIVTLKSDVLEILIENSPMPPIIIQMSEALPARLAFCGFPGATFQLLN